MSVRSSTAAAFVRLLADGQAWPGRGGALGGAVDKGERNRFETYFCRINKPVTVYMKLSVVIPAHNEEGSIASGIKALHAALQQQAIPHEILVINDHSKD